MRSRPLRAACALALATVSFLACRHPPAPPVPRAHDAGRPHAAIDAAPLDVEEPPIFGPPNPWGDGSIPPTTAHGPEADATRATLIAVRASIGFWRISRHTPSDCPTLDDLARTPSAAFDPASMRRDAWGGAIEIECQGSRVRVRSWGPDHVRDTPDDVLTE